METERKFLIRRQALGVILDNSSQCYDIRQAYVSADPAVRVRVIDNKRAELTIKKRVNDISSKEININIAVEEAKRVIEEICDDKVIHKTRHLYNGWEIDVFHGYFDGLVVAEFESSVDAVENLIVPRWCSKEVTTDPKYKNAQMYNELTSC